MEKGRIEFGNTGVIGNLGGMLFVMIEEVEKSCITETSNNLFWEGSREVVLTR